MPPETEGRQQHRMLQKEYGSLYRIVSDILFRHDPMELDGKHNIDGMRRSIPKQLLYR